MAAARLANDPTWSDLELHVILTDKATIVELNTQFLDHPDPTDVLAFDLRSTPTTDAPLPVGAEIYVCLAVAEDAAREYNTSVGHEVMLYIIHGLLHLAGENDHTAAERQKMRDAERRVMTQVREVFAVDTFF